MRNVLFFFTLFVLYSCANDGLMEINENTMTRSNNNTSNYYFDYYFNPPIQECRFDYRGMRISSEPTITSYLVNVDGTFTDLLPQIMSKPTWVNNVEIRNVYYKLYVVLVSVTENASSAERVGTLILSQQGSNKTLSFQLIQESKNNIITVSVTTIAKNRYEFTISTQYPVKGDYVGVKVPYEVYNDADKMGGNINLSIPKGAQSNSTIMDYNGSPIVFYHGDLKGCRLLSPISIYPVNDNFYNYVLAPY